jgi:hypothetical protein
MEVQRKRASVADDSTDEKQRLMTAHSMWRYARDMLRNLTKAEHPEWTEEQVHLEAARRLASGRD